MQNPKQDHSITTYLFYNKKDHRLTVGSHIIVDHMKAILDGLFDDYDAFIISIISRINPYIVEDIKALFLIQEERFEKHMLVEQHLFQANLTSTQ